MTHTHLTSHHPTSLRARLVGTGLHPNHLAQIYLFGASVSDYDAFLGMDWETARKPAMFFLLGGLLQERLPDRVLEHGI